MGNLIGGVVLIVLGSSLVIFRELFAEIVIGFQIWSFHMPFGKREVDASKVVAILVGLSFISIGILTMLGKLKWK